MLGLLAALITHLPLMGARQVTRVRASASTGWGQQNWGAAPWGQ